MDNSTDIHGSPVKTVENDSSQWNFFVFPLFVCLLACGLYFYFFVNRAYVAIELEVDQKTDFKIYWADKGELYAEENMSKVRATPTRTHYHFFLTNIGQVTRLRIDTHAYKGKATLKSIRIQQEGWAPIAIATHEDFNRLVPLAQIEEYDVDQTGLHVTSTDKDPNFELLVTPQYHGRDVGWLLTRFTAICFVFLLLFKYAAPLAKDLSFVPLFLFGVWLLIIAMAGISQRNVHPDEYVHMDAASYYQDHWLPPLIEDPAIRKTYSVYGVSRLNNGEVYYLLAGKFKSLFDGFQISDTFSLRAFNILLFGIILLLSIKDRYARMVALPLLISPQIWYIFSYCNSDAFGLFCSFLAGYQVINPSSHLHRYLQNTGWKSRITSTLLLSLLIGMLLLLKKNYYPFIVFFYLCLGAQLFTNKEFLEKRKSVLIRLVMITLAGLLIFGLRIGADYMVNGAHRHENLSRIQEELATPWYKPSTELHKKHVSLYLKERGTLLGEIIERDRWFEKSFQTGFGVYGYFTITASYTYYDLVRWTGAGVLFFMLGSVFLRGGFIGSALALSAIGLSAALIGVSVYQSWTVDFQAQGRYLFPIIPMLGLLYAANYHTINNTLLALGVTSMYLLGIYSFIFQGLLYIPKIIAP
jgi:hypothetical protein